MSSWTTRSNCSSLNGSCGGGGGGGGVPMLMKIAEAASTVIPFHCVICFDEFNTTTRPPMVLPCGHTFVCLACTQRLKKCMECRESLFLQVEPTQSASSTTTTNTATATATHTTALLPGQPATNANGWPIRNAHNHHHQQQQPLTPTKKGQPAPPKKVPLPIPKNLVLLALMEAAERTLADADASSSSCNRPKQPPQDPPESSLSPKEEEHDQHEEQEQEQEEEQKYDPHRILEAMATSMGPCGTYAVRDAEGLVVLPHDPRRKPWHAEEHLGIDDDFPDETKYHDDIEHEQQQQQQQQHSHHRHTAIVGGPPLLPLDHHHNNNQHTPDQQQHHDTMDFLARLTAQNDYEHSPVRYHISNNNTAPPPTTTTQELGLGTGSCATSPISLHSRSTDGGRFQKNAYKEPFLVQYGQKLQVVNLEDGVATLARDAGFLLLENSSTQLVKIGPPMDPSCRWEGLLTTIQTHKKLLKAQLAEKRLLQHQLQQRITQARRNPPQYPIISEPPQNVEPPPQQQQQQSGTASPSALYADHHQDHTHTKPLPQTHTTPLHSSLQPDFKIIPTFKDLDHPQHTIVKGISIDNADLKTTTKTQPEGSSTTALQTFTCGAAEISAFLREAAQPVGAACLHGIDTVKSLDCLTTPPRPLAPRNHKHQRSASQTQVTTTSRTAAAVSTPPHTIASSTAPASTGHVNFRSGLSGHYGLTLSLANRNPQQQQQQQQQQRTMRGSAHRGLGLGGTMAHRPRHKFA